LSFFFLFLFLRFCFLDASGGDEAGGESDIFVDGLGARLTEESARGRD
jgi:hypothetical protein